MRILRVVSPWRMMYIPAGKEPIADWMSLVLTIRLPAILYISVCAVWDAVISIVGVAVLMVRSPVTLVMMSRPSDASYSAFPPVTVTCAGCEPSAQVS